MASDIDICSNALLLIGEEVRASFSATSHGATVAANLYPETYKALLAEHPWSFATKEQQLSRLTATPDDEFGYDYAFQMPSDCLRVWYVAPMNNHLIVDNLIYSNETSLFMRYLYQVPESRLPAHFVKALEYKLASEFSVSITEDFQKAGYYEQKYMMALSKAKSIDSQQYPNISIQHMPFIQVR